MNVMSQKFNDILDRLTSSDMLEGKGRGNEIGFYIFDYAKVSIVPQFPLRDVS